MQLALLVASWRCVIWEWFSHLIQAKCKVYAWMPLFQVSFTHAWINIINQTALRLAQLFNWQQVYHCLGERRNVIASYCVAFRLYWIQYSSFTKGELIGLWMQLSFPTESGIWRNRYIANPTAAPVSGHYNKYSVLHNECPNFKTLHFCIHEPRMNETCTTWTAVA